eukprot:TRINITY_DN736_c0_g1_i2.p2 TRINITY_DN736_c0_g1~~TRINITY_DN736_c0_g1_i2.p2  ORF type:complete len:192 (+),score=49.21 TRINITY_DN736_c0_g1_i2:813-1388(+)
MFALGCITYFMLFGNPPFQSDLKEGRERDRELDNLVEIGIYDFPDPLDVSDDAVDFIEKLLLKEPEDRMTASKALRHRWIANSIVVQPHRRISTSPSSSSAFSSTPRDIRIAASHKDTERICNSLRPQRRESPMSRSMDTLLSLTDRYQAAKESNSISTSSPPRSNTTNLGERYRSSRTNYSSTYTSSYHY